MTRCACLIWLMIAGETYAANTVINQPINSFLGGQISPLMTTRRDNENYQYGCRELTNVQVVDVGAVTRRPGSVYVAEANGLARLEPFVYNEADAYVMEFTDEKLRFYRSNGLVLDGASAYEVNTPYSTSDIDNLVFYQMADVCYIVSSNGDLSPRKLVRSGHTSWAITDCNTLITDGPFRNLNTTDTEVWVEWDANAPTHSRFLASSAVFDGNHVGALWKIMYSKPSQQVTGSLNSASASDALLVGTTAEYALELTTAFSFQGTVCLQVSDDGGVTWSQDYTVTNPTVLAIDVNHSDVSDFGQNVLMRVAITDYDSGSVNYDLQVDPYVHRGVVQITEFISDTECTVTVQDRVGYSDGNDVCDRTSLWAEGAWSEYRGYPAAMTGHFGRIAYGKDLTVWFTAVDDFESFANNFEADDEAFTWTASQARQNPIRWLLGERTQNLVAGTLGKVMEIRSLDELAGLTPTNPPKIASASAIACSAVYPAMAESAILFADRTGRHIHELVYSSDEETVVGPDITQLAGSILADGVVQMVFQQTPWPTLWCVRSDGQMASCYYSRTYQVAAWSTHETDGDWKSVAVIPTTNGNDQVWTVVNRTIDGNSVYYVEYFDDIDLDAAIEDAYFVDGGLSWDGGDSANISAITKADPGAVTLASWPTGLSDGDNIRIEDVSGMTQINDRVFIADDCVEGTLSLTLDTTGSADYNTASYSTYTSGGTLTIVENAFGGASHLEGEDVAVWADGTYIPGESVSSGTVTLDDYYNQVSIGLPYTSTITPTEVDLPHQLGTTQPYFKRFLGLLLDGYCAIGGTYGPANSRTPPKNIPWEKAEAATLSNGTYTGPIMLEPFGGSRKQAMYTIVTEEPQPFTLRGAVPVFELEGN